MISIVVKGTDLKTCAEAARNHGVEVKSGHPATAREYVLWAEDDQRDAIAAWFAEIPEITPGYGYPFGTCLVYSTHPGQVKDSRVQLRVEHYCSHCGHAFADTQYHNSNGECIEPAVA